MSPLASPLVLASASPRRRELLERLGLRVEVVPSDVDEGPPHAGEAPGAHALRLACAKADAVAAKAGPARFVLAADTVVAAGSEMLAKPVDAADGARMLRRLAGREHVVATGFCVRGAARAERIVETRVQMRALSEDEIAWYVATGEGRDKAGGYGIQGLAAGFVVKVNGSYTNVVGLPLAEVIETLAGAGALAGTAFAEAGRGGRP